MNNDRVSPQSLDWAKEHIRKHGDTDIFPVPFEYDAIWASWGDIKDKLSETSLGGAPMRPHVAIPVPKTTGGFRVAQQLDPLDTLVYTAMVYEMGPLIEAQRLDRDTVCSYRFEPAPSGDFYPRDNGWPRYSGRSAELASLRSHVLCLDITDFYNQIYQHRVAGALETGGVHSKRAANVEKFLQRFTAKQSRGLPVGPSASHLLAECCLGDIDSYLEQSSAAFVRYVDDFRIFSNSRGALFGCLERLTKLLYTNHGLAWQSEKTSVSSTADFIRRHLDDPAQGFSERIDDRLADLAEFLSELSEDHGHYGTVSIDDLPDTDVDDETASALSELFEEALQQDPLSFGDLRYLLRQARALRTDVLYSCVSDNLCELAPLVADVCRYIQYVAPPHDGTIGNRIVEDLAASDYDLCTFGAVWVLDLFAKRTDLYPVSKAMAYAQDREQILGVRPQALIAKAHQQVYWVRSQKTELANLKPWDRRAVIWAGSILPRSERRPWLSSVEKTASDPLESAIARLAKGG